MEKPQLRLWDRVRPGMCIAVLALLAGVYPLIPAATMTSTQRIAWSGAFFVLMILEMVVITKESNRQNQIYLADRQRQDTAHLQQIAKIEGVRTAADAHMASMMRLVIDTKQRALEDDFRTSTLKLSEAVLDFLYQRLQNEPQPKMDFIGYGSDSNAMWRSMQQSNSDAAALKKYKEQTLHLYSVRFQRLVTTAIKGLRDRGEMVEELVSLAANVQSSADIQVVGERLGELAERLAQPIDVIRKPLTDS